MRVLLSVYLAWSVCFPLVALYSSTMPGTDLATAWDHRIPVLPASVWIYDACFLLPFLVLLAPDRHRINRLVLSFSVANLVSYCAYVSLRAAPDPPRLGTAFSDRVLELHHDAGFLAAANNCPSMHVIFVWLLFFACRGQGWSRLTEILLLSFVVAATASTLLTKMHMVADVGAGLLVAVICWPALGRWYAASGLPGAEPAAALHTALRRLLPLFAGLGLLVFLAAVLRRLVA